MKHFKTDLEAIEWCEDMLSAIQYSEKDREALERVIELAKGDK